jgi:hypothetical protein
MIRRATVGTVSVRPLVLVVLVSVLVLAWLVWRADPIAARSTRAVLECEARYGQAEGFRDSVKVDASYPTEYSQHFYDVSGPSTCGDLRREGLLR